ncbi:MAG: FMN-binding protein [Defluviitaleaceae bacterium]|nr:FMN-binding protein [Defluviitaleaceae bacterium]
MPNKKNKTCKKLLQKAVALITAFALLPFSATFAIAETTTTPTLPTNVTGNQGISVFTTEITVLDQAEIVEVFVDQLDGISQINLAITLNNTVVSYSMNLTQDGMLIHTFDTGGTVSIIASTNDAGQGTAVLTILTESPFAVEEPVVEEITEEVEEPVEAEEAEEAEESVEAEEAEEAEEPVEAEEAEEELEEVEEDTEEEADEENGADGVFEGSAPSHEGNLLTLEVTVEGGYIVDITVLSHGDTEMFFNLAAPVVISSIIAAQSTDVDIVSGATYTSNAIIESVNSALGQ